jgi:hypothetical protein
MFKDLNDMITDQLVIGRQKKPSKRNKNKSKDSKTYNMQDTLIVILSFVLTQFHRRCIFLLSFLISEYKIKLRRRI